uniref:RING-type E3 ubiquitin transferase n=1 Tax=Panstrongylus megistus TaxID=65343 RepID=A0A069DSX6_9HEMI
MDHWGELVALGIDTIIFGICSRLYMKYSYSLNLVERAHRLGINPDFKHLTEDERSYVIYQGDVKAINKPIKGLNTPDITGVIQRLTIREHAIARNASGFWADQKNTIQETYNIVPFLLKRGRMTAHILDPLGAEILDLDTVHNKFENSSLSIMDHLVGFFNGVRQRGIETTEELLKEGSVITAIGEVSKGLDGNVQLSPPSQGYPYFITSMPVSSLLRKLEEQKTTYRWLTLLFGGIGVVLTVIITRKWWLERQAKFREEELKRKLDASRKERRQNARTGDEIPENERCVVCRENPKEIIILQCGHVCICEDCSEVITTDCPVCRSPITTKAAAFIS